MHRYRSYNPFGVRLLNRLGLGFIQLRKHKFRHNFVDTLNSLCPCSCETEDTERYFLRCQNNLSFCTTLTNDLSNINTTIVSLNSNDLLGVILYRDKSINKKTKSQILTATIKFIKDTQSFDL